jgi:hypothetical protein
MKKFICLLVFVCGFAQLAFGDFIESNPVGPGIIHHHEFREAGPWHIHVLEIDLSVEWIHLETVKADDQLYSLERTSSMAKRNDYEEHRVIGAVNGDFYEAVGTPVGAQVLDGILLKRPTTRSVVGFTDLKEPFLDVVSFNGTITASDSTIAIDGVNETRGVDKLIIYNNYYGSKTGTNYWGTEVTVEYFTEQPTVNDTILVLVVAKDSIMAEGHGNNSIPSNGIVISGHGAASSFLNEHVFVGDTLSVILQLPPIIEPIIELIGGTPRLIRDGVATVEWATENCRYSFAYDRHPRTAVGFSQDSTKLYLFTVDGRQPGYSVGMSLYEFAYYMQEWDIYQGVNLDGGGSTTMFVRDAVVNSPSDAGGERSVANALMVVSTAPTGPLAIITLSPEEVYLLVETQVQFSATGFDQYYNPLTVDEDSLEWDCDAAIGTIDEDGLFTAGNDTASGYVYVEYGNIRDSARVYITEIASITLLPNPVILKVGEQQTVTAEARDSYDNLIELSATEYQWSVTGGIGEISSQGVFTATQTGEGYIIATYHSVSGSTAVSVGFAADVVIDDFSSVSNWNLTGVRVNLSECNFTIDSSIAFSPSSSGKLDYSLTTGGTSALYLNCSIPISGTPDAIGIHVYGDGKGHWLRGEFQDADGEKFLVNFTESYPGIDWTNSWKYLEVSFDDVIQHWENPSAVLTFPITWKKIYLAETDDANKDAGTIYFDDFTAHFIETGIKDNDNSEVPNFFVLEQNFPNPFSKETTITYQMPAKEHVSLKIYNISGQLIRTLIDAVQEPGHKSMTWDGKDDRGQDVTPGIYLYRLTSRDYAKTRKTILLK